MRRRILLLSVGMTTLVVLAFAVPLVILLRTTTAGESKDKALYRAETVAYYVGDRNHTADDITAYIDGLRDGPGSISVRMPDGTTLGDPPPGGVPTPKSLPDDYMIAVCSGGEKALAQREDEEPELRGFHQVATREDHPPAKRPHDN